MKRKSQSTQRRSSGQQSGTSRSRSNAGTQSRQSASGQRGSTQFAAGRSQPGSPEPRSGNRGGRGSQGDTQEWNFSRSERDYPQRDSESSHRERASFGEGDYGREQRPYASSDPRDRGFAPAGPESRREIHSRSGRSGQGTRQGQGNQGRFSSSRDQDYGRSPGQQEFRGGRDEFRGERGYGGGPFREGGDQFRDSGNFRDDDYRSSGREGYEGDWRANERDDGYRPQRPIQRSYEDDDRRAYAQARQEGYSSSERGRSGHPGDDFRREEGYEDEAGYRGSSREGSGWSGQDDRYYAGRGQRSDERESPAQRRQSGSRSGRSTSSSRRR